MLVSMPINGSASSIKRTPGNSREDRAWEGCNGGAEGKRRTCPAVIRLLYYFDEQLDSD
jgi:hypothetical protein